MAAKAKRKSTTSARRKRRAAAEPLTSVKRGEPSKELPLLRLSADEVAEWRKQEAELQQARPKSLQEARRELDRALRERDGWPPSSPPKKRRGKAPGRPRDYDHEAVRGFGRDLIEVFGMPETFEAFKADFRDWCPHLGWHVPGDTLLTELLRPLYRRPKKSSENR
jgi:hypothetical protein